MAWSGAGVFNRLYSWVTDAANAINITASRMDAEFNNYKTGLENCLTRDGQNSPSANLPMGGKKHTNVADATALSEYASAKQVQKAGFNLATFGGAADALTASLVPAPAVMTSGFKVCGFPGFANATTTPTLAVGSIPAKTIKKKTGSGLSALAVGDIVANLYTEFTYDAVNDCFIINAAPAPNAGVGTKAVIRLSAANSNCTGDNTLHTIVGFDPISDPGGLISGVNLNVFTAPVTGEYRIEFNLHAEGINPSVSIGYLVLLFDGGTTQLIVHQFKPNDLYIIPISPTAIFVSVVRYVHLTAGKTVTPAVQMSASPSSPSDKVVDLPATITSSGTSLSFELVS